MWVGLGWNDVGLLALITAAHVVVGCVLGVDSKLMFSQHAVFLWNSQMPVYGPPIPLTLFGYIFYQNAKETTYFPKFL